MTGLEACGALDALESTANEASESRVVAKRNGNPGRLERQFWGNSGEIHCWRYPEIWSREKWSWEVCGALDAWRTPSTCGFAEKIVRKLRTLGHVGATLELPGRRGKNCGSPEAWGKVYTAVYAWTCLKTPGGTSADLRAYRKVWGPVERPVEHCKGRKAAENLGSSGLINSQF